MKCNNCKKGIITQTRLFNQRRYECDNRKCEFFTHEQLNNETGIFFTKKKKSLVPIVHYDRDIRIHQLELMIQIEPKSKYKDELRLILNDPKSKTRYKIVETIETCFFEYKNHPAYLT